MKRGLTLTLMMVAVLALSVPAGAVAPVFPETPTVIIGEEMDGGNSLFAYVGALDADTLVDWRNPTYTADTYGLYWTAIGDTSGIDVSLSQADLIAPLNAAELDELTKVDGGAVPTEGGNAISADDMIVDLINLSAAAGPVAAAAATPAADGVADPTGAIQTGMDDEPTVLTLIATVQDGESSLKASAPASLEVYSLAGEDNSSEVMGLEFYDRNPGAGAVNQPLGGSTQFTEDGTFAGAGIMGYDVAATDDPGGKIMFASQALGDGSGTVIFPVAAAGQQGMVIVARARLRNDSAPTAQDCPGYRLHYTNRGFTHFGGIKVETGDNTTAPSRAADFWATVAWEVPYDTTDMADGGVMSNFNNGGLDYRDYSLMFDLYHTQVGDRGLFTVEELTIESIDAPTGATASADYSNLSTWIVVTDAGVANFQAGTGSATATEIKMATGGPLDTDNGKAYRFVMAFVLNGVATPADTFGRLAATCKSADPNKTANVRVYVHNFRDDFTDRNMLAYSEYGDRLTFSKFPSFKVPGQTQAPTTPTTGGSSLACWFYTHDQADDGAGATLIPDLSILSTGLWDYLIANDLNPAGWPDDDGEITWSDVSLEVY